MKSHVSLVFVFGLMMGSPAAAQCLRADRDDAVAVGMLSRQTFQDAAGRPETEFILTLPVATCLQGEDEFDQVEQARTLHLVAGNETLGVQLQDLRGRSVVVRGRPFGAMTVHHHAPIVMDVQTIDEQELVRVPRGSSLRSPLLDAARPFFEEATEGPVEFVVRRLNVLGDWAYGEVKVQRPGGKPIDWSQTSRAADFADGLFDPAASDVLLQQTNQGWMVAEVALGPTDVVWEAWAVDHQLPFALFQW